MDTRNAHTCTTVINFMSSKINEALIEFRMKICAVHPSVTTCILMMLLQCWGGTQTYKFWNCNKTAVNLYIPVGVLQYCFVFKLLERFYRCCVPHNFNLIVVLLCNNLLKYLLGHITSSASVRSYALVLLVMCLLILTRLVFVSLWAIKRSYVLKLCPRQCVGITQT